MVSFYFSIKNRISSVFWFVPIRRRTVGDRLYLEFPPLLSHPVRVRKVSFLNGVLFWEG